MNSFKSKLSPVCKEVNELNFSDLLFGEDSMALVISNQFNLKSFAPIPYQVLRYTNDVRDFGYPKVYFFNGFIGHNLEMLRFY
jgi:hypothetical protein